MERLFHGANVAPRLIANIFMQPNAFPAALIDDKHHERELQQV
jgi:hypothetical protein